jgi:transcriptional regulator with XRE-family HTH domain
LAHALRETRSKKGLVVGQLSKRSGVPEWVIRNIEGETPSYVPSEGNAALLAEALGIPVGSLLAERDRLVEGLRHRPCEAAKEYRGVST